MVIRLCDELDKANDINEYFKNTVINHITKTLLPDLQKKKGETLLKDYIKEDRDYIILVHFMRKMFSYLVGSASSKPIGSILLEKQQHAKSLLLCSHLLQRKMLPKNARLAESRN